jgi:hypothetical protein
MCELCGTQVSVPSPAPCRSGVALAGLVGVAGIAILPLVRCGQLPRWAPIRLLEPRRAAWDSRLRPEREK